MVCNKRLDPPQRFPQGVQGRGVRATDVTFPAFSKSGAGNYGDIVFVEEPLREFLRTQAGALDGREDIERPLGNHTGQAHPVEVVADETPPPVVFQPHGFHLFMPVF